jgi:cytochrome c5
MKPVSDRRKAEAKVYAVKRAAFLARRPKCQVCWKAKSKDVHHVHRRHSGNYLNEATWLAVCRHCHDTKIHGDPKTARANGWLV